MTRGRTPYGYRDDPQPLLYKGPRPLKEARKRLGLTQEQAAKIMAVSLPTWQLWERGTGPKPPYFWEELLTLHAGKKDSPDAAKEKPARKRTRKPKR